MELIFNVSGQVITCPEEYSLVAGTIGCLTARFIFDETWQLYAKKATFTLINQNRDRKSIVVVLDKAAVCRIPAEVLKDTGSVHVYCEGITAGADLRICPTALMSRGIPVLCSGKTEDAENTAEPTPSEIDQIMQMIHDLQAGEVSEEQIAKAVGDYLTEHPVEGISNEQAVEIVALYLKEHKEELKGEPGYTPVKGIDYWTEEDKESITKEVRKYIDLQIGGALDGTY